MRLDPLEEWDLKFAIFLLIGTVEVSQQIILAVNAILDNFMLFKITPKRIGHL